MKNIVAIIIALSSCLCYAQDAKRDFKKINESYANLMVMSFNIDYELFFDNNKLPSDKMNSSYSRDHNKYFVKNEDTEVLINEQYTVLLDKESKIMILDKSKVNNNPLDPLKLDLDSMFKDYEKVLFYRTGTNNSLSAYSFFLKEGPYKTIDVIFDPVTFLVKEIKQVYRYKMPDENNIDRATTLKISFSDLKKDPAIQNEFAESKYVHYSGNKIQPASSYSKYKLLTNLKEL